MTNLTLHLDPIEGRTFFVGDLHGAYDALIAALTAVGFDESTDRVISVGDLIDRGPHSIKCLRLLKEPWFYAVKGNHEDMMIRGLLGDDRFVACWFQNGGDWYNELSEAEYLEFKNDLAPRVAKLPYIIRVGDVAVVHAEVIKSHIDQVSLKDTKSMIWGRTRVQNTNRDLVEGVSHVVVGHTPVRLPVTIGNHVYIDTGACFPSGSLTLIQDTQLEAVEKA